MEAKARATKKQQELLEFVTKFIRENDYGPSYREIMRALDYKSVSTVATHIDGLIAKGFLTRKDNSARSLEVASGKNESPVVAALSKKLNNAELSNEDRLALERVKRLFS